MQICQFNFVNRLNSHYNLYIVLSLQEIIERRKKLTKKLSKPEENLAFDPNTNKIVPIKTDLASLNSASASTSAKKSPIRKKRVRKSRWSSGFIAKPKAKPKPKEKDEDEEKDEDKDEDKDGDKVTFIYYLSTFMEKKLNFTSKFITKSVFFCQTKRICFSILHFDEIFMLQFEFYLVHNEKCSKNS